VLSTCQDVAKANQLCIHFQDEDSGSDW